MFLGEAGLRRRGHRPRLRRSGCRPRPGRRRRRGLRRRRHGENGVPLVAVAAPGRRRGRRVRGRWFGSPYGGSRGRRGGEDGGRWLETRGRGRKSSLLLAVCQQAAQRLPGKLVVPFPMLVRTEVGIGERPDQRHPFPAIKAGHPAKTFPTILDPLSPFFPKESTVFVGLSRNHLTIVNSRSSRVNMAGNGTDFLVLSAELTTDVGRLLIAR
jgi:hypothetical protein